MVSEVNSSVEYSKTVLANRCGDALNLYSSSRGSSSRGRVVVVVVLVHDFFNTSSVMTMVGNLKILLCKISHY